MFSSFARWFGRARVLLATPTWVSMTTSTLGYKPDNEILKKKNSIIFEQTTVLLFSEAHRRQEVIQHFRNLHGRVNHAVLLRHAVDETLKRAFHVILQSCARCVLPAKNRYVLLWYGVRDAKMHVWQFCACILYNFAQVTAHMYLSAAWAICRCSFQTGVGWEKAISLPPSVKVSAKTAHLKRKLKYYEQAGQIIKKNYECHLKLTQNEFIRHHLLEAKWSLPSKSCALPMKASRTRSPDIKTTHWLGPKMDNNKVFREF